MESSNSLSAGNKITAATFAIIILTNKHYSILSDLINKIKNSIPNNIRTEIIIVQDLCNSQKKDFVSGDTTNDINAYQQSKYKIIENDNLISITHIQNIPGKRKIWAVLQGIKSSSGENVILMNDDFSHPPEMIPKIMESMLINGNCVIVAIEDTKGGSLNGRTFPDRVFSTKEAKILQHPFDLEISDPISKYIAFPKRVINDISIDRKGYSLSSEDLLKVTGLKVIEIPYSFVENTKTKIKLLPSLIGYAKSVLHQYTHGPKSDNDFTNLKLKKSVMFISKAARFYTVGASGLLINYTISTMLTNGLLSNLWYMEATLIGILASITSNFFLNKAWTFQETNFSFYHTLRQFILFSAISCFGALIQLGLVYVGVESGSRYWTSLLFALCVASISNFLLNKKWTFNDVLWG